MPRNPKSYPIRSLQFSRMNILHHLGWPTCCGSLVIGFSRCCKISFIHSRLAGQMLIGDAFFPLQGTRSQGIRPQRFNVEGPNETRRLDP